GMDALDERLEGRLEHAGLEAVDAVELVAPADAVRPDVPFEAADVRDTLRLGELAEPALELARAPAQLVVQAGVLDRAGRVGGQRLRPVHVLLAEGARLRALDSAEADDLTGGAERHADPALHALRHEQGLPVGACACVVEDDRASFFEDLPNRLAFAQA